MELQWPLILFSTFVAWSAGLFGTQAVAALRGHGAKAQLPALVTSLALLAVGGVAVFFHLQHWERIFNGFGHLTSGITQELIGVVLMVAMMAVLFVFVRKGAKVPAWACVVSVVVAVALVVVAGHSYMMAARPTWNSVLQILSLVGAALPLGVGTFALIEGVVGDDDAAAAGMPALVAGTVNVVTTVAFVAAMEAGTSGIRSYGFFFPTNHPNSVVHTAADFSPFAGDTLTLTVAAIVLAVAAAAFAACGKKKGDWKVWGAAIALSAAAGAICLRAVFFATGTSVFML